jgi:predicted DNA-binding protein
MEALNTQVIVRISQSLKTALKKLAEQDRRKLSDYIRLQLEKHVEANKVKK